MITQCRARTVIGRRRCEMTPALHATATALVESLATKVDDAYLRSIRYGHGYPGAAVRVYGTLQDAAFSARVKALDFALVLMIVRNGRQRGGGDLVYTEESLASPHAGRYPCAVVSDDGTLITWRTVPE